MLLCLRSLQKKRSNGEDTWDINFCVAWVLTRYCFALRSWLSAIRTLAALSSLSPTELKVTHLGPSTAYFPRQLKAMSRVSKAQAAAVDVDTKKPVGDIPSFEQAIDWYRRNFPDESKTGLRVVHGDFKIDNLVFHPTKPTVIGILDWELWTLGSPVCICSISHRDKCELNPELDTAGRLGQFNDPIQHWGWVGSFNGAIISCPWGRSQKSITHHCPTILRRSRKGILQNGRRNLPHR
jgi:hypothetical protein